LPLSTLSSSSTSLWPAASDISTLSFVFFAEASSQPQLFKKIANDVPVEIRRCNGARVGRNSVDPGLQVDSSVLRHRSSGHSIGRCFEGARNKHRRDKAQK
jgi:hypothetical protein